MSICVAMVAGEASGDLLGAHLMAALKARRSNLHFVGIGGPKMQAQGFESWYPQEKLAVRGFVEVLRHYREIVGIRRDLGQRVLAAQPALFIGVDAPDFNLVLEARLKAAGIPAVHYVSPSVWAWRAGRIGKIVRAVSHMLCLFPFEPPLYEAQGLPVTYVGHPLADVIDPAFDRKAAREALKLPKKAAVYALLPGSRQSELRHHTNLFLEAAYLISQRQPAAVFLVPLATRETRLLFESALEKMRRECPEPPDVRILFGHAQAAMGACDVALVASGTATLEAALLKTPMVITYRMPALSWWLTNKLRYQPWVGLPNILAGRFVVPELLQDAATPEALAEAMLGIQGDAEGRAAMQNAFHEQHLQLRQGSSERAAEAVLQYLEPTPLAQGVHKDPCASAAK